MRIVIVGLGGIGSILADKICRYINYSIKEKKSVTLVDGDIYEPKNLERQEFSQFGNKASIKARELEIKFSNIDFNVVEAYVNKTNIKNIIKSDSIVFLCVDNHKSRMIVNNYCKKLKNVILISGSRSNSV